MQTGNIRHEAMRQHHGPCRYKNANYSSTAHAQCLTAKFSAGHFQGSEAWRLTEKLILKAYRGQQKLINRLILLALPTGFEPVLQP